jgi:hypothetical protein
MKPHGSVRVVRKWHGLCTDHIFMCFDDPKGLNIGYLPSGRGSRVRELANGPRHSTALPSQDLSGTWVTIQG